MAAACTVRGYWVTWVDAELRAHGRMGPFLEWAEAERCLATLTARAGLTEIQIEAEAWHESLADA